MWGQMWGAGVQGASSGWAEAPTWWCLPGVLVALCVPAAGTHNLARRVAFDGAAFPLGGVPAVCAQEEDRASSSPGAHPCAPLFPLLGARAGPAASPGREGGLL